MTLITSISGIRGTIGGKPTENLTPIDIAQFTAAYCAWLQSQNHDNKTIIVGRDARISGPWVSNIVCSTAIAMGFNIIDAGLSTTPTIEIAVIKEKAAGGIIVTASHNPKQWNALKLLNNKGEFIDEKAGNIIINLASENNFLFADIDSNGKINAHCYINEHIEAILKLPLVNIEAIKDKKYRIVVDAVNSTGGIAVPRLLKALGVDDIIEIHCTPNGIFPHNPEPLPEHLGDLISEVKKQKANLGIVVDPDVDRLAIVCENGDLFGEEYTLVAVADYVLKNTTGNTVSNLSSTRALKIVTEKYGGNYNASAVGEVNVVEKMKLTNAIIGGEGNGGVIYPELHYGRDALVGIALFLSHLATSFKSASLLRSTFPNFNISKNKIDLPQNCDADSLLSKIAEKYKKQPINLEDGLKIDFDDEWVHLRKSNTEPIIRIYVESASEQTAQVLAKKIIKDIGELINKNNGK